MITLLTDFGTADYFVPAVKGVILSINPQTQIIDLTHEIPAHDIEFGAFTLSACYQNFPDGTIHVAVVDPGVGSARRAIVVDAGKYFFVGPDNGVFGYVYAKEPQVRVFHATNEEFFRRPTSPTFHGRDVFAPLAAYLSSGLSPESVGPEIEDYVRLDLALPTVNANEIRGSVIHIDHFGNCITNLTEKELSLAQAVAGVEMTIASHRITQFGTHFAAATKRDELIAYPGSAGYWEIGLWQASAAQMLGIQRSAEVVISLLKP